MRDEGTLIAETFNDCLMGWPLANQPFILLPYLFYISEEQVIIFVNESFDVVCHIPSIMLQSEFLGRKKNTLHPLHCFFLP